MVHFFIALFSLISFNFDFKAHQTHALDILDQEVEMVVEQVNQSATISDVYWENDYLEIALYESIEMYANKPKAYLLVNGKRIDASFYQKGVQYTSLSVVNSNHPKIHQIYYEARFEGYSLKSVHPIIFDIKDIDAPTIADVPSFRVPLGQKIEDLTKGILAIDNYSQQDKISITVSTHQILINKVGIYEIVYTVKDESNNSRNYISSYEVYDHIKPEIEVYKILSHDVHKPFNYLDYFKVKDNYDSYVTVILDLSRLNINKIGIYEIVIKAVDLSLNETSLAVSIQVVDREAPQIKLVTNVKPIDVYQVITKAYLLEYVLDVSDNYDHLGMDDIIIRHEIDTNRLGIYVVEYTITDKSLNKTQQTLKIEVKDQEAPIIEVIAPLNLDVHEPFFNNQQYFHISDNFNDLDALTIVISEKINLNKIGTYQVSIKVTDQSKNTINRIFYLNVVDRIAPTIKLIEMPIFSIQDKRQYQDYLTIVDNYDSALEIMYDETNIVPNQPGMYLVYVKALDLSQNETTLALEVEIVDIEPPTVILSKTDVFVNQVVDEAFITSLIVTFYDDVTPKENIIVEIMFEMDDLEDVKTFTATLVFTDESKNICEENIDIHFRKKIEPLYFYTEDVVYMKSNPYIPFKAIKTNVSFEKVKIVDTHLDMDKPGKYEIIYYYQNQNGEVSSARQNVIVESAEDYVLEDYKPFLIVIVMITATAFYGIFYLKRIKKNVSIFDNL